MLKAAFLVVLATLAGAAPAAPVDLVATFDSFARADVDRAMPLRVAAFKERFGPLLPGFYPRTSTGSDARIAKALTAWPAERGAVLQSVTRVRNAYADGTRRFRATFPDYRPVPMFIVHSMGELDGGVREVEGRTTLLFGADMIAKLHAHESIGPLVDHELFHTYHLTKFADCGQLWCSLWIEGLATYVAATMNPRATDGELLFDYPAPIRAVTEANIDAAMCAAAADLDSRDEATIAGFIDGSSRRPGFASRFGYYVGYRIAQSLGRKRSLAELAAMPAATVRAEMERALRDGRSCPPGAAVSS